MSGRFHLAGPNGSFISLVDLIWIHFWHLLSRVIAAYASFITHPSEGLHRSGLNFVAPGLIRRHHVDLEIGLE